MFSVIRLPFPCIAGVLSLPFRLPMRTALCTEDHASAANFPLVFVRHQSDSIFIDDR